MLRVLKLKNGIQWTVECVHALLKLTTCLYSLLIKIIKKKNLKIDKSLNSISEKTPNWGLNLSILDHPCI